MPPRLSMFQHRGIWLPDGEQEFTRHLGQEYEGRPSYQISKFLACLPYVNDFSHALDIGAHVGLWTLALASKFAKVTAFEPVKANQECWIANTMRVPGTWLIGSAAGEKTGSAKMQSEHFSTSNAHIGKSGAPCQMVKIDDLTMDPPVGFIKIDAEGYELPIVRGAEKLIRRDRPVMIIEQKEHTARYGFGERSAVDLVCKWGAEVVKVMMGDYICRFP